jgi:hypothetical protein
LLKVVADDTNPAFAPRQVIRTLHFAADERKKRVPESRNRQLQKKTGSQLNFKQRDLIATTFATLPSAPMLPSAASACHGSFDAQKCRVHRSWNAPGKYLFRKSSNTLCVFQVDTSWLFTYLWILDVYFRSLFGVSIHCLS